MSKSALSTTVIILSVLTGHAIAKDKHCSLMEQTAERSACYTELAKTVTPRKPRDWFVTKSMANASVVASKTADHRVMCAGQIGTVTLGIICKENAMSLYFSTGCVLGDTGEEKAISVQVDDESPREQTFVIPNRKLVLHLADHRDAIEFVKPMLGRDQMKVRITPPSHPPFTATFAVAGLDKAILPSRDACGW